MAEEKPNRIKLGTLLLAMGGAAMLPFACDDKPKEPASSSAATGSTAAAQPSTSSVGAKPAGSDAKTGGLKWTKPTAWTDAKSASSMRVATYQVAKAEGDAEGAEMSVIVAGGSATANIERWEGQFGGAKAKTSQKNPNNTAVTVVEIEGDYTGGGPMMGGSGEKKPGFMLLGAIVTVAGGQSYFFKLTGPKKTMEAARKDFEAFVDSIGPAS
jgi:hypothetical protein